MIEVKYPKKIRIQHFRNMVAVALSDDYLDLVEAEFLADKAKEFHLNQETVDEILSNSKNLYQIVPENKVDRENQLADIIYIAIIDGILRPNEYELCVVIAKKLDFDKNYVDEAIKLTIKLWKKSKWYARRENVNLDSFYER